MASGRLYKHFQFHNKQYQLLSWNFVFFCHVKEEEDYSSWRKKSNPVVIALKGGLSKAGLALKFFEVNA